MPTYAKNKKAYFEYEVLDEYEAGIMLNGDEVKSIKLNQANLKGSYIDVENDEAFINSAHISPYKFSQRSQEDIHYPTRRRKLLLSKKEIAKIDRAISEKGITAIPLSLYAKKGLIKLKVGICRGKKLLDKRETIKRRQQDREIGRQLKNF